MSSIELQPKGAGVLAGVVVDAASKAPISGAKIVLTGQSQGVETDGTGRFRLEGLPRGKVEFDATASGYAIQHVTQELKDAGETSVEVALKGGRVLAGQVVDAASKAPISGAKIILVGQSQGVYSDASGRFRLEGLPTGKVEFDATASGYGPQHVTQALKDAGETSVEVALKGGRVLAGQVVDAASKAPISGAKIVLAGQSQGVGTDAAGGFHLDGLPPGKAEFDASASGYASQHVTQELKDTGETSVEVLLKGPSVLTGVVVDAGTKKPIAASSVQTRSGGKAETNAKGEFRIEGLKSGPSEIQVAADGYNSQQLTKELAAAQDTAIRVEIEPAAVTSVEPVVIPPVKPGERIVRFCGIESKTDGVGFVVDCSGSMGEGDRIGRAKAQAFLLRHGTGFRAEVLHHFLQ